MDSTRIKQSFEAIALAMLDADAKGLRKGNGGRGEITCPACNQPLRYSVADVNGHMHGCCTTEDCIRWIQ